MESRWGRCFSSKITFLGLIHHNIPNTNKKLWKLKIPLKIKIFLCYLKRGVILTKDNLARRNWQESQQCYFCHEDETIQHFSFDCHVTRLVWASVYTAWGLPKPNSVSNMFGYQMITNKGSVWCCRNAVVFDNKKHSFLQLIFATTHWLRTWAILQRPSSQDTLVAVSYFLAQVANDFFVRVHGWQSSIRIDTY